MTTPLCVITGANSGIGFEASIDLSKRGYDVVLCCRTMDKAVKAKADIESKSPKGKVFIVQLDLADLDNVKTFRERYDAVMELKDRPVDVLVLNAGIMALDKLEKSPQGHEMQWATNCLGHFAFAAAMIDLCKKAEKSRVVVVSSFMHKNASAVNVEDIDRSKGYSKWNVYSETKLGNLLFVQKLNRLLQEKGLIEKLFCVGVHPGFSSTGLQKYGGADFINYLFAQSAERGALPTILAVTDPEAKPNGYAGPNGLMETWGAKAKWNCALSKSVFNEKNQDDLWAKCEELTHADFEGHL